MSISKNYRVWHVHVLMPNEIKQYSSMPCRSRYGYNMLLVFEDVLKLSK